MAEAIGLAASIAGLVQTTRAIYKIIERLRMNTEKSSRLLELVGCLTDVLESAGSISDQATELVQKSLQEVKSTLESLVKPRKRDRILNWCLAEPHAAKLEKVERRLQFLRTEVVVVENFLQLKKEIPKIYNAKMELPKSAGASLQNRAMPILTFLQESKSQELRVIGVHGLPGVGKSTILNYIWQEASSSAPFSARAHVQIGHTTSPQLVCTLQTSIVQQLGGGRFEFTSPEGGKEKLNEHFRHLKDHNKPVFLAIDNVFDADDLQNVLPFHLSPGLLPSASCIAVTCRDFKVIEALQNICHLCPENHLQVFHLNPPCLDPEESRVVFAECGDLSVDKDAELLSNLAPLCRGLPLALTILGKIFAGNANREKKDWERIKEEMQDVDQGEAGTIMVSVEKSFRLSYERLGKRYQAAFLDVVNFFYGWSWEKVENIVGASVLKALKDSSLISEADSRSTCNQSAVREGSGRDYGSSSPWNKAVSVQRAAFLLSKKKWLIDPKVVSMHDLILQFGERLHTRSVTRITGSQSREALLQGFNEAPPKLIRNLLLWHPYALHVFQASTDHEEVEFLEKTSRLQMLQLDYSKASNLSVPLFKANYYTDLDDGRPRLALRYLSLKWCLSSRRIMEMKVSSEIREIHLSNCEDVEQLPDTPLRQLERLCIKKCKRFQGFSSACVKSWQKLKRLEIISNACITSIPAELGRLESLENLYFRCCPRLESFPSLCNAKGPSHLVIEECQRLKSLPAMSCPLQTLVLKSLAISSLTLEECAHLQLVELTNLHLEELPIPICNAPLLEVLCVNGCKKIEGLPPGIGNATSLQVLEVVDCKNLEELPDEVGNLTSLRVLRFVQGSLKALLPAIGNLSSLRELDVGRCESLAELPDEVGSLNSLESLAICHCKNLKALPPAIGKLSSLRILMLVRCESLKELPPAIGKLSSLETLFLRACESLEELPDEVARLTSLRDLNLAGCKSLKVLPPAIGKLSSLEALSLDGCESLEELPDEVARLTSLRSLSLFGCKSLKVLPPAIGKLSSLEWLCLGGCESLEELPDEVARLTLMKGLDLSGCKSLKVLPPAIGNLSSLEKLSLGGCESLEELPDEVARLTSLKDLDLSGCKSLKVLPPAIGKLVSSLENRF